MKTRRAFTLVEMVTSISVGSVLLVLAMGTVHRTMRIESTLRENALTERTAARLSRQFRHDMHLAESVSLDRQQADEPVLQIELPGQSPVSYRVEHTSVHREQAHSDTQVHREHFSFPENFVVNFRELTAPQRVVLTVQRETGLIDVPPRLEMHVEAVIGRFLRLRQPKEASQ